MKNIMVNLHIMWYEYKMVPEALDSLYNAIQYAKNVPEIRICLNEQTYLERPIDGTPREMFDEIMGHPIFKIAKVIRKTNDDPLYNIGDWRREQYNSDDGYTVWGESDCVMPYDFFYILENFQINYPHILTFSTRKMWDSTWDEVEFVGLDKHDRVTMDQTLPPELRDNGTNIILTQETIDRINDEQGDVDIIRVNRVKFDGALVCLSGGLPHPFIAPEQRLTHEDFCAQIFFQMHNIPQFHVKNRLKGHNAYHPLKRQNTLDKEKVGHRFDIKFEEVAKSSRQSMENFLGFKVFGGK